MNPQQAMLPPCDVTGTVALSRKLSCSRPPGPVGQGRVEQDAEARHLSNPGSNRAQQWGNRVFR
jgi:hypothetical protein